MFISIPKDFFVPVLFTDNFTLNLENNNMEYDMYKENEYRSQEEVKNKENTTVKVEDNSQSNVQNDTLVKPKVTDLDNTKNKSQGTYKTEESEEKEKVDKEIELDKENDNPTLDEADEEFIHSQTVAE